ncbi:MAG: SDR family NAD(P)-dependent oxidoreductase [Pseudomonadota bacterium]
MRFEDKTAVVVGAADGIGRATCRIIAAEGGTVIGVDKNAEALNVAMGDIRSNSGRAAAAPADAVSADDVTRVTLEILDAHPRIDILVNCVGGSTIVSNPSASLESMSLDEWQSILDFNLTGTFLFTKAVIPVMKRQGSGKIVNLSSIAGRGLSDVSSTPYATAKGGIVALTRKLSLELGPHGITVNAVAPGKTLSGRIRSHYDKQSDADKAEQLAAVPLGRFAEPEDQAYAICFLASYQADMITGVTLDVNGGVR